MPIHAAKLRKRGFNQTLILAEYIKQKLNAYYEDLEIEIADILVRNTNSKTQIGQNNISREGNLEKIFSIYPVNKFISEEYANKYHVLLIDDVYTTGTTLKLCFAELVDYFDNISAVTFTRR